MHKIVVMSSLALASFGAIAGEHIRFDNLDDAIHFVKFRNAADGVPDTVMPSGEKPYGQRREQAPTRQTHQEYLIDGMKVIVTSEYKGEYIVPKPKEKFDANKALYMEECISLTQNMEVCKELWKERQK